MGSTRAACQSVDARQPHRMFARARRWLCWFAGSVIVTASSNLVALCVGMVFKGCVIQSRLCSLQHDMYVQSRD
jgi:hypothetical protein